MTGERFQCAGLGQNGMSICNSKAVARKGSDCGVLHRLRWFVGLLSFVLMLACEIAVTRGVAGAQSLVGAVPRTALMSASTA